MRLGPLRRACVALVALACAALPAAAGDLIFGIGTNTLYDDNVYALSSNEIGDFTLQLVPKARYIDRLGSLGVDIRYDPTYEYFADESKLRGWNHYARGAADWSLSPTTAISFENEFWRYRSARLLTDTSSGATPIERGSRDPFSRNRAQLSVSHALSPTQHLTLSAYHVLWDFSQASRVDQASVGGDFQYLQMVAKNVRLGGAVSISHAEFDDQPGRATADSSFYSAAVVVEWDPLDRLLLHASTGPALVDGKREQPEPPTGVLLLGPIPAIDPGRNVTAFANLGATWELDRGTLSFGYERRDDVGSAVGFSAVTNAVTAHGRYDILRNWFVELNLVWEGREGHSELVLFPEVFPGAVLPVAVEGDQVVNSVSAALSTTYRITEATKLFASTLWRSQDDRSEVPSGFGDADRLTVYFGVTHQFAAIRW